MSEKRAIIVDDEPDIRELLEITLGRMDIDTAAAADLAGARKLLDDGDFDLCLTDMQLPDGNGLELVRHIAEHHSALPVAVITAFGSMDTAITALKAGAFDFVQKPVDLEQLRALVESALKLGSQDAAAAGATSVRLIGTSGTMTALRGQIAKLARSQAPIYISGESGSGKEVAARLIHEQGPRATGDFVPVNCGAIPSELMESEFFGHVKGSFTGAVSDKEGLFQAAAGGTLFLDEVADLPLSMQVKLLRAIQEKAVRAVGSATEHAIDVRILSATHKDLVEQVANGSFRQDLYYRLNVIELAMPPLRDRREDIDELSALILERLSNDYHAPIPKISAAAMAALKNYRFPGNVRELENVLERAFTLCENGRIEAEDLNTNAAASNLTSAEVVAAHAADRDAFATTAESESTSATEATREPAKATRMGSAPDTLSAGSSPGETSGPISEEASVDMSGEGPAQRLTLGGGESLEDFLESAERQLITDALEASRWNKTAAAKALGITFRALRYRLKKLDLE